MGETYKATALETIDDADVDLRTRSNHPQGENDRRAARAAQAVIAYRGSERDCDEAVIGDLLADLRHLCDALSAGRRGQPDERATDFDWILETSTRRYNEEILGEL